MTATPIGAQTPVVVQILPMATVALAQHIMLRHVAERRRFNFNGDPQAVARFAELPRDQRAEYGVLHGQVHFGVDALLTSPAVYVTMLRDPVDCVAALYYLIISSPSHYLHRLVSEGKQSIDDLLETRAEFDNPMVRRLNEATVARIGLGSVTERMLETAKRNLAERYVFGIAEMFDESLLLFRRMLGWEDLRYADFASPPSPRVGGNLPSRTVEHIRRVNAFDVELHRFATDLFRERLAAACPNLEEELVVFRDQNRPRTDVMMVEGRPIELKPPPPLPAAHDLVWIASYPRSGNTWLRLLLHAYALGPAQHLHELGRLSLELDWWLARAKGHDLPHEWVVHAGRQVQGRFPRGPGFPGDLFVKSHFLLDEAHPLIDRTRAAVCLVRDPRDVLLSGLNYAELTSGRTVEDEHAYARQFIAAGGDPGWIRQGYGSWEAHAASWATAHRFPVLVVRYEDLKADASREFGRVLEFVGALVDPGRLEAAVAQCDFQKLRNLEVASRATSNIASMRRADRFFFHKGLAGQSLTHLGEDLEREFMSRFGPAMKQFGYT